jgi:hypothetical protein
MCGDKIKEGFNVQCFMTEVDDFYDLDNLNLQEQLGFLHLANDYYCSFKHFLEHTKMNINLKVMQKMKVEEYKNKMGGEDFLYFFQLGNQNIVKIGVSNKPPKRKHDLETKLPYKLTLLKKFKFKDAYKIESLLHEHFDAQRMNGEWFQLDVKEVNYIKNMNLEKMVIRYLNHNLNYILNG